MSKVIPPIISATDLLKLSASPEFVLIDARFGKANYDISHLKGAYHVDLNTQLSDIKSDFADGGRHPLPTASRFSELLASLGISPTSNVVVYDDKNGANAAARFWWMMKAVGHEKIQVLDGGMDAAIRAGFPVSSETEKIPSKGSYKVENWQLPISDISEIDKVSQDNNYLIIDVRENERYRGEKEPIDLVAGHIPGAVNIPFASNLDPKGLFLSPTELKAKYEKALEGKSAENVIVHCGSGVTACHTLLAMAHAGMEIPKLYVGSWSEWSRNGREIATELE
jgi:thiosulfate/3-mercaptopyruvate sulfurtransferase